MENQKHAASGEKSQLLSVLIQVFLYFERILNLVNLLAPGYRFDPSEQQILQYLLTKVTEKPLPSGLPFMEQDLYAAHPRDLFRSLPPEEKIVYCFTNLNRRGAKRFERTVRTGSNTVGSWKTQQSSNIYDAEGHGLIGVKKLLTFQGNDTSTGFSIREYHLAGKFSQVGTYIIKLLFYF
ncbi:hypothetical protein NMG60_11033471 [Bertholletia excelsa]